MKRYFGLLIISFLGGFTPTLGESGTEVGAKVPVKVAVPEQWRTPPFDRERVLTVPLGATISVLARVRGARFLAVSPNGDILVSQPSRGKILLIRQSHPSEVYELISGLRLPHGMVFHRTAMRFTFTLANQIRSAGSSTRTDRSNEKMRKLWVRTFLTEAARISAERMATN